MYDPRWAESWDAVGLVCGDPDEPVRRVLLRRRPGGRRGRRGAGLGCGPAAHPPPAVPAGCTSSVAATTPKGRVVHRLVAAARALLVAHTNADVADPGVSDALAAVLGLRGLAPLAAPTPGRATSSSRSSRARTADALIDALAAAGAGTIGDYERAPSPATATARSAPREGANPTIGRGASSSVAETRVEMVLPRTGGAASSRRCARRTRTRSRPSTCWSSPRTAPRGLGRIGTVAAPERFDAFVERVAPPCRRPPPAYAPPATPTARCGRSRCAAARETRCSDGVRRIGVDAYVTADLRHHPVSEARRTGRPDAPASSTSGTGRREWPWLADAARASSARWRGRDYGGDPRVRRRHRPVDPALAESVQTLAPGSTR